MEDIQKKVEWVLRVGVFGTFLGHGIFALGVKSSWIPLLTTIGFSESSAIQIMPVIGCIDITVAFCILVLPIRIVLIWATFWAFCAALMRPISGEPIWEFIERTANWSAPLALLLLHGMPKKFSDLFVVR